MIHHLSVHSVYSRNLIGGQYSVAVFTTMGTYVVHKLPPVRGHMWEHLCFSVRRDEAACDLHRQHTVSSGECVYYALCECFLHQRQELDVCPSKGGQLIVPRNRLLAVLRADAQRIRESGVPLCNAAFIGATNLLSSFATCRIRCAPPTFDGLTNASAGAGQRD